MPRSARQQIEGKCELMASNAVRAKFQGMEENDGAQSAVFEVQENIGHRRFVRYGDGAMPEGSLFKVPMNSAEPGQPAQVKEEISKMKPGEEAVMKVDHLFVFGEPQGQMVRPCTRIARVQPAAPQTPQTTPQAPQATQPQQSALPTTVAPLTGSRPRFSGESYSSSFSMRPDGQGGVIQERIDTVKKYDPSTGQVITRMYINGTEVDPNTRQPLQQPTPAATPQNNSGN